MENIEFQKVRIKSCTVIIILEDFDIDNILIGEKIIRKYFDL